MAATAGHTHRQIEWYVITDEADLTLRITNGLKVGEDRQGELTLNHPVAANRWLEFLIDADGELSLRRCRRDVEMVFEDRVTDSLVLQPGNPIFLPNNRMHISNSFRRGASDGPGVKVRCIEIDSRDDDGVPTLGQIVITKSDLPAAAIPGSKVGSPLAAQKRYREALVERLSQSKERLSQSKRPAEPTSTAREALEAESIETALIPVEAQSPFATEELSDALRYPIQVTERRPRVAANGPDAASTPIESADTRLGSRTYLWSLITILGLGLVAAMLVAINSVPDRSPTLISERNATNVPSGSQSRTEALLASVTNILKQSDEDDLAAWEFAVRSYEYILKEEPDNNQVRDQLRAARSQVAVLQSAQGVTSAAQSRSTASATTAQTPSEPAATRPNGLMRPDILSGDALTIVGGQGERLIRSPQYSQTEARIAGPAELTALLDAAERRIEVGNITGPSGDNAAALLLSVLEQEPTNSRAINLLNDAADRVVDDAEAAFAAGQAFRARNTLEEVFAFHPRHARANERWLTWTGRPGPGARYEVEALAN